MSNKQSFIAAIEYALAEGCVLEFSQEAREYFEELKQSSNPKMTENGIKIIDWLDKNSNDGKSFTAKQIAEGLSLSSRTVSGSMNKLVKEGYVSKEGKDPVHYIYIKGEENYEEEAY